MYNTSITFLKVNNLHIYKKFQVLLQYIISVSPIADSSQPCFYFSVIFSVTDKGSEVPIFLYF